MFKKLGGGGGGHVVSDRLRIELIFMKCSRSLVTIAHHLINHLRIKEEEGSIISVLWHFVYLYLWIMQLYMMYRYDISTCSS